jgi:hypothetical protein
MMTNNDNNKGASSATATAAKVTTVTAQRLFRDFQKFFLQEQCRGGGHGLDHRRGHQGSD